MDFLQLEGKSVLVIGVANRKSIAYHVGRLLTDAGARVLYSVRSQQRKEEVARLLPNAPIYVCDVEFPEQIEQLRIDVARQAGNLHGIVHSIAFADYSSGIQPFHETSKQAFLRSCDICCYSLMAIANALKDCLDSQGSVVTISISDTRMASENYGYVGPLKAALDSTLAYLAKSFSKFSKVRFNAVAPGLLKTSASAGIPGYVDSYLFAEQVIPRRSAVTTQEVAHVAAFLLSPRSSGINAQSLVIDAGMSTNYFDRELISKVMKAD